MSDDKLNKYKQATILLEEKLNLEEENWGKVTYNIIAKLKGDIKQLYEIDADIVSYKQTINAEIRRYALMLHKENRVLKGLVKTRFEWYSTKYQINVKNGGDRMRLIESDVSDIQYKIDILDTHIDFLKSTDGNYKQMGYTVKNRIELLNILGIS